MALTGSLKTNAFLSFTNLNFEASDVSQTMENSNNRNFSEAEDMEVSMYERGQSSPDLDVVSTPEQEEPLNLSNNAQNHQGFNMEAILQEERPARRSRPLEPWELRVAEVPPPRDFSTPPGGHFAYIDAILAQNEADLRPQQPHDDQVYLRQPFYADLRPEHYEGPAIQYMYTPGLREMRAHEDYIHVLYSHSGSVWACLNSCGRNLLASRPERPPRGHEALHVTPYADRIIPNY